MDIKIPNGPPGNQPVDATEDALSEMEKAGEAGQTEDVAAVSGDAIQQIAEQVAAGTLSQSEAVEKLLDQVLDSGILQGAPSELREEIAEILQALVETDPALLSLKSKD